MKRKLLVSSILMGLTVAALPLASVHAQNAGDQAASTQTQTDKDKKKTEKLSTITVTGSLIPQAQIETASPVITLSTQQLEKQGFGTVYDALRAQPIATGAVQDNQFTNGFTPGATTISLLGLNPDFTLFLINGHPMADYPLLYNGSSNFVDLTNIPVGMVDHIDILPGNQSSIYGSSAIAGVVNIILKDRIDGYELNVRGGGYSGGGGTNERVEFLGGKSFGNLDVNFGVQLNNQKPIWGYQRDQSKSTLANPDPDLRYGSRNFLWLYYDQNFHPKYADPGQSTCTSLSNLYGGTTDYEYRPGRGYYCGSKYDSGYGTILNSNRSGTAYVNLKYKLNDSAEAYANVLYNVSTVKFSSGPYFWETNINGGGLFVDQNTGRFELFQHIFAPEEIGSSDLYSERNLTRTYNAFGGVRGTVGNNWDYDIFYARSQTNLTDKNHWPLAGAVDSFFENQFLGPKLGSYYGYPIYAPNVANFYKAITPAQYASFIGLIDTKSETWTQNVNIQVNNTDLFELPAGSVGFAGLFQVGNQAWQNPTDPRVIAGDFYGLTGTSGGGTRNNFAAAAELRVPITSMLTADASVRYDQYANQKVGGGDNKATYKLGLEFRPLDTLLFRGNYATAFRAPDMAYSFGGQSGFYQGGLTDYYRCAVLDPTTPLQQCPYYASTQVFGLHEGSASLQSVTAKSYGFGAVWSPTDKFDIKADYYNVRIKNEVELQDINQLLKDDAACLLNQLDPNSPTCKSALAQVKRSSETTGPAAYQIQQVIVLPVNVANERVSGIVASLNYGYDLGRWGDLKFGASYNVTLKHSFQQFPFDPTIDLLRNPFYSSEFKSIANGSVTWDIGKFSATLLGTRYGKTPNYFAQLNTTGYGSPCSPASASGYVQCTGTVAPWMVYNGSVSYNLTDDMKISGIVNNIKNSKPPYDSTYTAAPYFNIFNYSNYGRSYWVEFDWKFGKSSD
ncbi:MAG: TonB-dependent receptor [Xanthomonadaceae bacterium]|nr:TonB-dependent receptor [Xanthomonadaceae bacterium]